METPTVDGLRTFLAIHAARSFSRAAVALNVTQPAVSTRIRLLERDLGVALLERTRHGVRLTDAGQVLLPFAQRAVAALGDAAAAIQELRQGTSGKVSLAVVGTLTGPYFTAALHAFAAERPQVEVRLQTARSVDVGELVLRGDATIGLRYHRQRINGLDWAALGAERLVVVCAPNHPRAGRRVNALASLRAERWIAFPESSGQRETSATHVFGLFVTQGLGDVDWTPVDSLTAQKRLVEGGYGIALMPRANVEEELRNGTLAVISVRGLEPRIPVFAVTRSDGFISPASRRMMQLLAREFRKHADSRPRRTKRKP